MSLKQGTAGVLVVRGQHGGQQGPRWGGPRVMAIIRERQGGRLLTYHWH